MARASAALSIRDGNSPNTEVMQSPQPNATLQAPPIAEARNEHRLLAVACRVEPMVTHPAPPQTRTCAINAYGSSSRAAAAPVQSTGLAGVTVGERKVSPVFRPCGRLARRRLPCRGSLGPRFPTFHGTMRRYDCHPVPLGLLRLSRASRSLACFGGSWSPLPARAWGKPPDTPGPLIAGPPFRACHKETKALSPSSRVTPVKTCPALRPRWCPAHAPSRAQDCCPPVPGNRRLSPHGLREGYPIRPRLYTFRGSMTRPAFSRPPAPYGP